MQTGTLEGARLSKFYFFIYYVALAFSAQHSYIHSLSKTRHLQGGLQVAGFVK